MFNLFSEPIFAEGVPIGGRAWDEKLAVNVNDASSLVDPFTPAVSGLEQTLLAVSPREDATDLSELALEALLCKAINSLAGACWSHKEQKKNVLWILLKETIWDSHGLS